MTRIIFSGPSMKAVMRYVAQSLDRPAHPTFVQRELGEPPVPGLWFVADEGVYVMPNTVPEGEVPPVCYGAGFSPAHCDPGTLRRKRIAVLGGDAVLEFVPIDPVREKLDVITRLDIIWGDESFKVAWH